MPSALSRSKLQEHPPVDLIQQHSGVLCAVGVLHSNLPFSRGHQAIVIDPSSRIVCPDHAKFSLGIGCVRFELCPFPPEDAMCGCLSRVCARVVWFDGGSGLKFTQMKPWFARCCSNSSWQVHVNLRNDWGVM